MKERGIHSARNEAILNEYAQTALVAFREVEATLATSRLPYAPSGAPVEIIESPMAAEAPPSDTAQGRGGS